MKSRILLAAATLAIPGVLLAQSEPRTNAADPATTNNTAPTAPAPEAAPAEAQQELEQRQAELAAVAQQIEQLQTEAEKAEPVRTSKENYRETMRSEMVRAAPDLEPQINRQAELVVELTTPREETKPDAEAAEQAPAAGAQDAPQPDDDLDAKFAEYRELRQQLLPVEQKVQSNENVQTSRQQYFETLIAEMERIDPNAPQLLAKHRELTSIVRQLAAQAQRG